MFPKPVLLYLCIFFIYVGAKRDQARDRHRVDSTEENHKNKGRNRSDHPTTTARTVVDEAVVEKFVETLLASERYLKMIEIIERKLNHLDATFHEKTNTILKYVSETLRVVKTSPAEIMEKALTDIKIDLDRLKQSVTTRLDPTMRVESAGYHGETPLDTRISTVETMLRSVMGGVDSIVATMAEVKNRQNSRTSTSIKTEVGPGLDSMNVISEFRKILQDQRQKKCECRTGMGRVDRAERYPTDCHEIQMQGFNVSGIYKIKPEDMEPFYILCDLITAGGGWTVFQNRYDGSQEFYKGWSDYKYGFGNLAGEFWLGLEKLHYLTNQKLYELRVEVETQHGHEAYAGYSVFTVGPEYEGFRISTLGTYYGTAGDSLTYHAGQKFSTYDSDNDEWKDGSCASEHGGAWWYKECDKSNLNGKFATAGEENRGQSIYWISFKGPNYPLSKTKMMIRPLPASKPIDFDISRKHAEIAGPRPAPELKSSAHPKEVKPPYDANARHSQYRYDDAHNAFFPSFA